MSKRFFNSFESYIRDFIDETPKELENGLVEYQLNKKHIWLVPYERYSNTLLMNKSILVYEDEWWFKKALIQSRMGTLLGVNKKISGRQCQVETIEKQKANIFLENNHLKGACRFHFSLGLTYQNECIAIACFSKGLPMKDSSIPYHSFELIRFATQKGISVRGGLSKLISAFCKSQKAQHLMTYTDNDWGEGIAFQKIGFKNQAQTKPLSFWINRKTHERSYKKPLEELNNFIQGLNHGNTKWILDLR